MSARCGVDVRATRSPLDVAESAFRLLTIGPDPLALDCAGVGGGVPTQVVPLDKLRALLLGRQVAWRARDGVWVRLVTRARCDAAWKVGAAGVALPGLRSAAGRLASGYRGDSADIDAEVLAGFLDALGSIDLRWRRIAMHLCRAGYDAGLRYRKAEEAHTDRSGVDPESLVSSAAPPQPWGHPDLVLVDAVAKGVITAAEADLIGRTRLEKVSVTDLAAQWGVPRCRLYQRRRRAEERLVAAIRTGEVSAAVSNLGS